MLNFTVDWLNVLIRWTHLLVGIGWIGTSFYFIALDLSLKKRDGMDPRLVGTSWLVHGGGFYNVEKFKVAPEHLPKDLKWYQWDAYSTFLSGFLLMSVQYYFNAKAFLIDPAVMPLEPRQAIAISVLSLLFGWLAYDAICRSPIGKNTTVLAFTVFALIEAAAYGYTHVFSGRGAFIHVGAFVGTIMACNVFRVIIPGQKKVVASLMKGEEPDARLLAIAKQRSVHNNYLTLPVLLMMVSNHYAMLTGHPQGWLIVAMILVVGAGVRHIINSHDAGIHLNDFWWVIPFIVAGLGTAVIMTANHAGIGADKAVVASGARITDSQVMAVTQKHCIMCHSPWPTHEGYDAPPKDVILTSPENILRFGAQVEAQAVKSTTMPLGNETGITPEERKTLGLWIEQHRQ